MTSKKSETNFAVRLVHARQLASRFAQATDELNTALSDAEKALAELRLGVSASILIQQEDIGDPGEFPTYDSYLKFCKTGKMWRLLIESGLDDGVSDPCSSPVCDTSREMRLLAAKHLPALLEKLIETAEVELQDVEANTHAVKSLVKTIRSTGSDLTSLDRSGAEVVEVNTPPRETPRNENKAPNQAGRVGAGLVGPTVVGNGIAAAGIAAAGIAAAGRVASGLVGPTAVGNGVATASVAAAGIAAVGIAAARIVGASRPGADVVESDKPVQKSRSREVAK